MVTVSLVQSMRSIAPNKIVSVDLAISWWMDFVWLSAPLTNTMIYRHKDVNVLMVLAILALMYVVYAPVTWCLIQSVKNAEHVVPMNSYLMGDAFVCRVSEEDPIMFAKIVSLMEHFYLRDTVWGVPAAKFGTGMLVFVRPAKGKSMGFVKLNVFKISSLI